MQNQFYVNSLIIITNTTKSRANVQYVHKIIKNKPFTAGTGMKSIQLKNNALQIFDVASIHITARTTV